MSSYLIQVYARYIFYLFPRKRRKDYYIFYSVKEFRGKGVFHFFHYSLLQIPNRRSFRQETQRPCKFLYFITKEKFCQRLCKLCLPHTCGAKEQQHTVGFCIVFLQGPFIQP